MEWFTTLRTYQKFKLRGVKTSYRKDVSKATELIAAWNRNTNIGQITFKPTRSSRIDESTSKFLECMTKDRAYNSSLSYV